MEIQYLSTLSESKREERVKELRTSNSSKKASPLIGVINSDAAFKCTDLLVNHGSSHFMEMPEMNVKWLHRELCGVHGGVWNLFLLLHNVSLAYEYLSICSLCVPL